MTTLRDDTTPTTGASAPAADADPPVEGSTGIVEAIHIAAAEGGPMRPLGAVRAIAGVGLEGDRYATRRGRYSGDPKVDRDLTLIEAEEIERLAAEHELVLAPGDSRRNLTTRRIRLNALVGRRFRVGDVVCEGTRLCEPCQYLTDLLGKPVLGPLVHRAGLRARILTDGEIALDAEIVPLD